MPFHLRPSHGIRAGLPVLVLLVLLALVLAGGCQRSGAASPGAGTAPPEVQVEVVTKQTVQPWDEFNGRVAAVATVEVRARVSGYLELDFTEVRSPIAGRASRALLTPGNLVQADQSLLTTVVSQDPVHVHFDADEHRFLRHARRQREGSDPDRNSHSRNAEAGAVRIGLADEDGFPHQGQLDFTDNQLQAGTGTIRLRAVLTTPSAC